MLNEKFQNFEELINFYLGDKEAKIERSEIKGNDLGIYLLVHYTLSDSYAKQENLCYKKRTLEILLQRKEGNEGSPISSYARR